MTIERVQTCTVPGCPNLVTRGMCRAHKRKAKKRADKKSGRVRGSRWTTIRRTILREQPFCTDGRACGHKNVSVEVDHIKPLSEGGHPTDRHNLQGICRQCHDAKTRQEQREQHGFRDV